jgi:primosomal protein N' (replication factor Y) (superfamily II helicase)
VPSPLHRHFDYLPPVDSLVHTPLPGMRVRVPFGKRQMVGILLEISNHTDIPANRLKTAERILDLVPVIPVDMLALARWAADYYHHPIGEVIQALLPVALRQGKKASPKNKQVWRLTKMGREADMTALKRAPKQHALWQLLVRCPEGLDAATLSVHHQVWSAPLNMLVKRGWVEKVQCDPEHKQGQNEIPTPPVALNPAQTLALGKIRAALGNFQAFLLDGVTGSGKTEVYLQVIAEALQQGRQALVLVPEISLTPQLLERFSARFGAVAVYHSGLSDGERLAVWLAARDGRVPVVIGTRSAVFLPLKNPGVIVVDEEHDTSFKQQDGFRYSARDIAVVRAQRQAIPIVLGSATPSLESLHNVDQLRYTSVTLPERAGNARHPSMRLLDIRGRQLDEGLSDLLLSAMRRHLSADGQVLLFLNRRGYAPTVMCHACGETLQCARCDARLTLHGNHRLQCHHCGAERALPAHCNQCGAADFAHMGQGTQRIERALERLFPDVGIARIDRDSTRRKGSLETLLESVHNGSYRILVGTQMLAKGHDFPDVTLVGILDADQGLFGVDFRASERMAQLIVQVAGRAGRAQRPGEVLIQTHHPDHPLLTHLVREGYGSFACAVLAERRVAGLPPYAAMAVLRAEAATATPPGVFLETVKSILAPHCGRQVQILGPAPAPMERRAGRYRAQLLLLASQRALLQQALTTALPALGGLKEARRVRWSIDIDSYETY